MDRPWELDLLPLLIPPEEWAGLEAGLQQRAELLNLTLADIYGPQRLLREGFLPPSLIFSNPGYLRACHGVRPAHGLFLLLHAADLARAPDGQWWILSDRTQAPSGSGYALENRIVLSRVLPFEFRECQVQRLASFFRFHRDTLRGLSRRHGDNPNVVLLTPGPHNETYFEHAYLARYLGFTLVEGGDLTVRDQRVFIKTLEGLQPVDVILRRVDDSFCDPLELRGDSFLGIAGLLQAARAGNVTIANALGSGLLESPAFLAFLPGICRLLMGEELKLPSVATWWCGQGKEQKYVLENLDAMVVKHAFGSKGQPPFFGDRLSSAEISQLASTIQSRPYDFVGQEQISLSGAPVWASGGLSQRPIVLRAFTAAGPEGCRVMPGGLTRVSNSPGDPVVSMQSGGGSKDTWVVSDGPVSTVSLLATSGAILPSKRAAAEVPSRVADNLFWLGRYAERLEGALRLLRCIISRMADESALEGSPELSALAQVLVALGLIPERFAGRARLSDFEKEILLLIYSQQRMGSVRDLSGRIRQISSVVRDRFSADTWRILNQLQTDSRTRPGKIPLANALSLLNTLLFDLAAFSGMEMENMTRGHGWRFLDFGRRLERGVQILNLLRAASTTGAASFTVLLEPLLEIADSVMTYRRRYFAQAHLPAVLDLLLIDATNPRSLASQLAALLEHSNDLPRAAAISDGKTELERVTEMSQHVQGMDVRALFRVCEEGSSVELLDFLDGCVAEFNSLSDQLTHHYFSHTTTRVS
jgi:uncharacterized circularly permuted ATP-grasp superfamily protein/uncharacterized alpha-E superfamily protein